MRNRSAVDGKAQELGFSPTIVIKGNSNLSEVNYSDINTDIQNPRSSGVFYIVLIDGKAQMARSPSEP